MLTDLFLQIKQLIIKNKLKEACNLLMDTAASKEAIDLMARVEKLDSLIITNQISNEEASREESRIRQALLTLVEKLETGPVQPAVQKNRLPLVIGGVVILLLVPLGIWMSQKTGKVSCEEIKKPYTIVVADFMREEPAFAQRVVAHLQDNFSAQPDLVGISPMGRFLDPLKAREDTFSQVIARHCVEKGLILYGTLSKIDDEKLFNGYIKLEGLKNASLAAEKTSVDRVIFTSESNIKVPDEINFSIAEQAQLVSDFTTGLLKYYLGDTAAIAYFQKTIQKLKPASEEKLKDVANLYLGNTYLAAGKAEKALKIYDEIGEISPIKSEITWNQSLAHIQLKQFDQATRKIVQYVQIQNQPLQVQDTLVILKMKQEMEEILSATEANSIFNPIIAVIPELALKLKAENRDLDKNSEDESRDEEALITDALSQPKESENQSTNNND
ncbi:MAG: hypothetical protein KDD63_27975, partial [Bacteroidetes bacterium]|nr:hypothetical protein [Bacteroidota bacterium]